MREADDARTCLLVIIGITPEGKKELVALDDGLRESTQSWRDILPSQGEATFEAYIKTDSGKHPKVVGKLVKNRQALLAFYDFPAEHWIPLRTTNPMESTFATVHHRTTLARNWLSRSTFLGLAFNLVEEVQKIWRRIRGAQCLTELQQGIVFKTRRLAPNHRTEP